MVPLNEAMQLLSKAADNLNQKTDDLNRVIGSVEARLQAAGIGLTCWLKHPASHLHQTGWRKTGGTRTCKGWCLGYTKIGSKWQFAVQLVEVSERWDPDVDGLVNELDDVDDPIALLKAPRAVRVEAAEKLEHLIQALTTKANGFVSSIENASELALG